MATVINGNTGIDKVQDNTVPPEALTFSIVGQVIFGGWASTPTGYLKCDGAAVLRTTYSALFTAIGTTFGIGDGSTTFNLPDLRGEFIRGWDDGRGIDSGRAFGSSQLDAFKSHSHRIGSQTTDGSSGDSAADKATGPDQGNLYTSSTGGTETRPRNVALLAVIKY